MDSLRFRSWKDFSLDWWNVLASTWFQPSVILKIWFTRWCIFIKNVVAVAAYSRLASWSQAKFQTIKLSPLPLRCTSAPAQSTVSTYRPLRFLPGLCADVSLNTHCPSGLSLANSSYETKIVGGCCNARQWLSGVDAFEVVFWSRSRLYSVSVTTVAFVDKIAEQKSRDRSSSTESQLKFPGCTHYRRRNDNHYRCQQCHLNEGLTLCTEDSPCEVCKDRLPEAWLAQEKVIEQKRKAAVAAKAAKKSQERDVLDDLVEIHAPEDVLQLLPTKRKSDGSSKSKRAKTATGSGSKATEAEKSAGRPSRSRDQKKTVSSSLSVAKRPKSDGGSGSKGSERHRSRSGERSWRSHGSDRHHDSPRPHHSSKHDSGHRESGERSRPRSSGGSSSRRQAESADVPGSSRVSSRATEVRPSGSSTRHHHQRKTSVDHRSLSASSSRASVDRRPPAWSSSRSWKTWKFGEVWIVLCLQTRNSAVPGIVTIAREKNHHGYSVSDPSRWRLRVGRCDGSCRSWRPGNSDGSDRGCGRPSRWRPSRWQTSRWRVSRWRVSRAHHFYRWRASNRGGPSRGCRPSKPSGADRGRPNTWWWRPGRCSRPSTPSGSGSEHPSKDRGTSGPWYSCREHTSGRARFFLVIGFQRYDFSVIAQSDQPDSTSWLHDYVDSDAT